MQALQNKTLAALESNTNAFKSLGHRQQSSFLDERAALLTLLPNPSVTLKENGGKAIAVENDLINVLLEMVKQTNKQFHLISADPNANKHKINGADVSLLPDGERRKLKSMIFLRALLCLLLLKM